MCRQEGQVTISRMQHDFFVTIKLHRAGAHRPRRLSPALPLLPPVCGAALVASSPDHTGFPVAVFLFTTSAFGSAEGKADLEVLQVHSLTSADFKSQEAESSLPRNLGVMSRKQALRGPSAAASVTWLRNEEAAKG